MKASVSYHEFRNIVADGNLAFLYEVNYEHLRKELEVPQVTEPLVQTVWRYSIVPRAVVEYVRICRDDIITLRLMPKVQWSLPVDRRMLRLLRCSSEIEVAYQLRQEFGVRMTRGAIKGRFYNILRHTEVKSLREYGLSKADVAFLAK